VEQPARRSTRHSEHWHFKKETEDVYILQILYNSMLNFYYVVLVVIVPVGHCCKPQPSVIIIIILITVWLILCSLCAVLCVAQANASSIRVTGSHVTMKLNAFIFAPRSAIPFTASVSQAFPVTVAQV